MLSSQEATDFRESAKKVVNSKFRDLNPWTHML